MMSADQNTSVKLLFSKRMNKQMESNDLNESQWGSRKERRCVDAAMASLLTYENARVMKETIGEIVHNSKSCYDRIPVGMSNICARKHNVDENVLKCRALCKKNPVRRVKTELGVSTEFYRREKGEPELTGETQGSGDVPSIFLAENSMTMDAHDE